MIIIYTQELDNAAFMAASLGGIITTEGTIKTDSLESHKKQVRREAEKFGYLKTTIDSQDAAFIWGSNIIRAARPSDYGFKSGSSEGFFPPELKFLPIEENRSQLDRLMTALKKEEHKLIYDASVGLKGKFLFSSLYQYANLSATDKRIKRIEISSFTEDDIRESFANPLDFDLSERIILKRITQQYIYYLANNNLPLILPGKTAYPRIKSLAILDVLTQRSDKIDDETSKDRYTISLQAELPRSGSIIMKSRKAVFQEKDAAKAFTESIPQKLTASVSDARESVRCDGPHSATSIMKAAQSAFHYPPQKTAIILQELYGQGYINSANSNARTIPKENEKDVRSILKMLSSYPNLFPGELAIHLTDPIEEKVLTDAKSCGILPTKKKPGTDFTESQRNVYSLIAIELIKTVLGRKIISKHTVSVQMQAITFSMTETILVSPGFSALDKSPSASEISSGYIKDGDILNIQHITEKKTGAPPKPYLETEILKLFTQKSSDIIYKPDELTAELTELKNGGFIINSGQTLVPSEASTEMIHELREYDGLIKASSVWDDTLSQITDTASVSKDTAALISSNLIKSVKDQLKTWISQRLEKSGIQTSIPCPVCGKFLSSSSKALTCMSCGFKVDTVQFGKTLSVDEFETLFKDRTTDITDGFYINGKETSGRIYLSDDNNILFSDKTRFVCPRCKNSVSFTDKYTCQCGLEVRKKYFGHALTDKELEEIFKNKKSGIISDFNKRGSSFSGVLYIDENGHVKCIEVQTTY